MKTLKTFKQVVEENKHILWDTKKVLPREYQGYKTISAFDYTMLHTDIDIDDAKNYYKDYVVIVKENRADNYNYTLDKGKLTIYEGKKVLATISNVKLAQANRLFKEVVMEMRGINLL